MPSPSDNPHHQTAGASSSKDNAPSYALQEYLRADPTVTERCSRAAPSTKKGKSKAERKHDHNDRAEQELRKFDDTWRDAARK
ncbi:hypothetical protein DL766_001139 [Monosporascus sp. MC13-8B]|uniref:Uncharacterized protein n=1 Tax=Monosporascus cannonballus TaxID=155416 RepID=A0ABY0HFC6_9PEZI|nr:hypothetical protein DL762_002727 [Monosporascus cannonballus]RYO97641.1 hypothetical protein DL763_002618 [Monosporascus cannonballus]RYP38060.1 hypothetical protein DL766_001139 [Monosporascus sp. MC13-8B]